VIRDAGVTASVSSAARAPSCVGNAAHLRRAAGHQEEADAGGITGLSGHTGGHHEGVGFVAGGHHALHAGECPAVLAALRVRGAVGPAVACAVLVHGRHHQGLARGDARQPRGLQLGRRGRQQCRCHQRGLGVGRVDQATAQLLAHHHGLDGTKGHAAVALGHHQPGQAQIGQLGVDRSRGAPGLGQRVPPLEAEALVHPAAHRVAQRFLVVGEVEVHGLFLQLPSTVCATMLRCTSFDPP
jgi:hypothetical protein